MILENQSFELFPIGLAAAIRFIHYCVKCNQTLIWRHEPNQKTLTIIEISTCPNCNVTIKSVLSNLH